MNYATRTYVMIAGMIALVIATIGSIAVWSSYKISRLERSVETHKKVAEEKERGAAAKEVESAAYKEQIAYLEGQLAEIRNLANKQDEDLKNISSNTRSARLDVDRTRRTRAAAATAAELCAKLAQVGHPCD